MQIKKLPRGQFSYLFTQFQLSYVAAAEYKRAEFAEDSAGDSVPIAVIKLFLIEICAYNRRKSEADAVIEHVVDRADRKLIRHLRAEVVDDEQVAIVIAIELDSALVARGIAEAVLLKIRDHTDRARVDNVEAAVDKRLCKRG